MDYGKIYARLIDRARTRILDDCFYEKHHIIPLCLDGPDVDDNIVNLTPEEHYIAHLLLVKIHSNDRKLIYAAKMMTVGSPQHNRKNNKLYGWLKRLYRSSSMMTLTCNTCGKKIERLASRVKRNKSGVYYCNHTCSNKFQKRTGRKKTSIEKECLYCGEIFKTYPHVLKKGYGKFCSVKCSRRYTCNGNCSNKNQFKIAV